MNLVASDPIVHGQTIVVIEDTPDILELIEVVLSDEGYRVISCEEADGAIDTVATERPALVIADLKMAGVQRWELVDAIIDDPRTGHLPMIVCSGAAAELREAEERLRDKGVDVLLKPFDIDELVTLVHTKIGAA